MPNNSYRDLMRYAQTGIAAPDMTYYDRMKAIAMCGGTIKTLTGVPPLSFRANGKPLISWDISGNAVQNGTPAPDAPIVPEFCGKLIGTDWTIPITCAGQTTPIYLGQTQTVRRVRKLVLTGKENWQVQKSQWRNDTALFALQQNMAQIGEMNNRLSVNTHFISVAAGVNPQEQNYVCSGYHPADAFSNFYYIRPDFTTIGITSETTGSDAITAFKSWLAQQYTNGTPVTVWYVLATPTTGIVNEPLMRIGNYADELHSTDAAVTIPTARGSNTLTVDTTVQPSSMTIVYKG